ncbi:MAG: hypothetical protein VXY93_18580, partial [Pseudomonadota bacterium]|nr:hypothetical protein [Pseudomonadota bacterium]
INISGVSTFAGLVDINAGGQANTFKVEDLTAGRVVLAGTGGELEDNANLTFNGSTLGVTGNVSAVDGTFSGNVSIGGTLTYEDVTNIDSIGIVTARSGLKVGTGITFEADGDAYVTGITTLGRGSTGDVYLYNPANTALSGTENSVYGWKAKTYCGGLQVNSALYLSRSGSNGLSLGYNNATGSNITAYSGFLKVGVPYGGDLV